MGFNLLPYDWLKLKGSKISKVKFVPNKYDLRGDILIQFNGGAVYKYSDVPEIKAEKLVHSPDPGAYFEDHIRPYFKLQKENIIVQN